MNRLVRDLLSLSRVESEERVRPQKPVDLAALVRSAASTLRPMAEEAGLALDLIGTDVPAIVPGDADQLSQILSNLIENAVKYGRSGTRVTVSLDRSPDQPYIPGEAVTVTVADDGDGIDPLHIPRLTERFYRVDDHRSRELGGTGLGLAIVKHIVNRHRGRLRIESAPGQGSRFSVVLPAAKP
jgi:two-component system phosphate regulon sensor histidine kinase PhoR